MDINDLKKQGTIIKLDGEPFVVSKSQHARTAQRRAFVRTTLKNLISGNVIEKTFNASDRIEEAEIDKSKASFLYQTGDIFHFMNLDSFEEISLSVECLAGDEKFLKEGLEVTIITFENKPILVRLPQKINYKVVEAPPAIKGDTEGKTLKIVKLENDLKINAPFFIESGEEIIVNTETGQYVERKK